ncbi:MAG: glutamine cyclotransferase [Acidimicrobiales bacterium]|jgi:glutaminyl-peptide cyclotransferase
MRLFFATGESFPSTGGNARSSAAARIASCFAALALLTTACSGASVTVAPATSLLPAPTTTPSQPTSAPTFDTGTEGLNTTGSTSSTAAIEPEDEPGDEQDEGTDPESSEPAETTPTTASTTRTTEIPPSTSSTTAPTAPGGALTGSYRTEVLTSLPHDSGAYTQGLELYQGRLLESTGKLDQSDRRWTNITTGATATETALAGPLFGEGITIANGLVYQLTYQNGLLIIANIDDLSEIDVINYEGEGWGICHNGSQLVMSNGSDQLLFRDIETFAIERTVTVRLNGSPVAALNELECVGDQVLANVYGLNQIVAIDSETGNVDAVIDASGLKPDSVPANDFDYVLNGIAHNPVTNTYYLTGKWWPTLYEVRLVAT